MMRCLDYRVRSLLMLCATAGLMLGAGKARVTRPVSNLDQIKEAHAINLATLPVKRAVELNSGTREWCRTEIVWKKKAPWRDNSRACATEGACDSPGTRDSWIPSGSTPIRTMRIKFNVFRNSDGSSAAATQADVDAQVAQLNADFAPSRIQWQATTQFINNTTYRQFADSEEAAMKNAYADAPATQLNVYVVNIQAGYLGVGTFAWDPDATGTQGGLIIDDNWFGAGQKTLTHEVGHCVGLWHTHHGVSEVAACSACYEQADGTNGDTTGDFASDTAPTPTNYNCSGPGGSDSCSGTAWGATDPQNYMGYAPDSCYTEFSPQQWGRTNCWSDATLSGWRVNTSCNVNSDCDDGIFCNGAETCVGSTCQAGSDPCPGQACDEATTSCVAAPTLQYEWTMDTDPGWTTQGLWAWGTPSGGGGQYGGPDPTSGATGNNVYGYNLAGDYENNLPETHLTTTAIDCSNLTSVSVKFQRWLGVEVNTYDNAYVRVSNNGTNWTTVWQNGAQIADSAWSQQTYDISAIADGQSTVYIRWTQGTTDGSWQFCGWNIDDVQIWGTGAGATCNDGILNQGEDRIDCGGPCAACNCIADAGCDDGLFCNGAETCDGFGNCQAGTAVNCDDGVGCTTDSCNNGTASCDNVPNNAACDDGLFCNGAETCDAVNDCQAGTAVNCNDGVACTDDSCNEGTNSCDNVANDANCDNGLYCDGIETCDAVNDCQAGTAIDCNDGVGCTDDSCNEGTNSCDNIANNANCDNGIFCDGAEVCDVALDCQAGTAVDCNDGVGCTTDSCNEATNSCDNIANNAACDDGLFCNGTETCDAVNDCQAGTAVNCNDGVGCTDDVCNEATNSCDNIANDANCDNGLYCDGVETCDAVNDCQAGTAIDCNDGVGCTTDSCNEATNSCDNIANDAACDNGIFCDGAETCDAVNDCVAGTAVNCDDGVGCTIDSCNEGTNSCDNIADNAACDNGIYCDGVEICDAVNDCVAGTAVDCNDGVGCTDDSCNEATASCDNVANNANCPDDGLFCNGTESCDAVLDCVSSGDPCGAQACDEATMSCVNCLVNADCDDGLFCNGAETCSAGVCQAGVAVDCNDGVACTADSCNEGTASCDNVPNDAACDNGLYCDGAETCDAVLGCLAGTAVDCNDGVGCTSDSCNEGTNSCDNVANNASCDNGIFCDGVETCDAVNDCQAGANPCPGQLCDEGTATCADCLVNADCDDGLFCNGAETCSGGVCQAGTAPNCDDGIACTTDSCNNGTSSCDNVPNDAACDNGLYCDGAETCDAVLGCLAGTAVDCNDGVGCTDDSCNEATNSCDNVANNANCPDDGLFCNGSESCDAVNDCISSGNPCTGGSTCNEATNVCDAGVPPGEGFILSRNADFSTDDRTFFRNETLYMRMWTDVVDFNDISRERYELRDTNGTRIRNPLTNHFDGTWTASFALVDLPTADTTWTWKGEVKDNPGNRYKPQVNITVLDAPACSINADCDDADACTTDVCNGGTCSNTAINCDDGDPCTADSCSAGVCVNTATACCGDGTCDAGEDQCSCPSDCGAPAATETSCTDGIDNDCDAATDCADPDCSGDPACSTPTGEGFILSLNPDFSTDDRVFNRADTIYMKIWTDVVDFNDINRNRWELKDPAKNKIRQQTTNHFDGTYTASFNLSGLPSNDTSWTWKGEAKDNAGNSYKPTTSITVNP